MKTNIPPVLITFALVCLALAQNTQAVNPPPDGGYPGGNTAEGQSALLSLSSGTYDTAIGVFSLISDTTGGANTALGAGTLLANGSGNNNTATGAGALLNNTIGAGNNANGAFALFNNSTGSGNIAIGYQAGLSLTTGNNNIDIGNIGITGESNAIRIGDPAIQAVVFLAGIAAMSPAAPNQAVLVDPTTGQLGSADIASFGVVSTSPENTAVGDQALFSNMGASNTATGFHALFGNTMGLRNTANGALALLSNTTGSFNTANGAFALFANTTGADNTANGNGALTSNTTGFSNTANGSVALVGNITGHQNTANGTSALFNNTTGSFNTATGERALVSNTTGNGNTAAGQNALASNTTGSFCTALGEDAGFNVSTANNVICIGAAGENVSDSCYIENIFGQTSAGGVPVLINSNNKLGTTTSSKRFKEDIKPMDKASEAILALKPVTFRYKKEIDAAGTSQFGLVAEEVEKVKADLVMRDKEGNAYSVRYDQVNAMLLNEFLKEHRTVLEQKVTIAELKHNFAEHQKQIEALAAGLQKVSAQLKASKPAPQMVLSNQ
jgi:trimeric autotransporter adhesin